MITTTFICDFGSESVTVYKSNPNLPDGWTYAQLTIGSEAKSYLCCPAHQNLELIVVPAESIAAETPLVVAEAPAPIAEEVPPVKLGMSGGL